MYRQLGDIDPRYRESAEESLVETAQLMAALVENASRGGALRVDALEPVFRSLYARRFSADIYGVEKTRVELRMTVVDRAGTVVFDSRARRARLGAASTRAVAGRRRPLALARRLPRAARPLRRAHDARRRRRPAHLGDVRRRADPRHLARRRRRDHRRRQRRQAGAELRPVRRGGAPEDAASSARPRSSRCCCWSSSCRSGWCGRSASSPTTCATSAPSAASSLPRLGRRALGAFGAAYDEMRDALAGRNYVADYVQTMTHEVKGPLSAIRGAAELLQEPMADADRARFVANIARETQRIQELVDRMMELTALESRRSLDARRAGGAARARRRGRGERGAGGAGARPGRRAAAPATTTRSSTATPSCCSARSPTWSTTRSTSRRPAAASRSRSSAHARSCDLVVRDRGPGIPDFAEDKVFEKFYSLARPATAKKSTGLGLSFVKEIADLHRGRATLKNQPGGGAVATLSLPRSEPRRAAPASATRLAAVGDRRAAGRRGTARSARTSRRGCGRRGRRGSPRPSAARRRPARRSRRASSGRAGRPRPRRCRTRRS